MQTSGRVIVVGAGIAGLVAGYRLQKAGFEVEVLEATERVGGRMCTDRVNGYIIDRGAQFLSTAYPILLSLMKELGIADKCVKTSPWVAVLRDGMFRRLKQADLLSMLLHGLLEWHEWVSLVWAEARIRGRVRGLPVSDFSAWSDFDDEDTLTWCNRHFRPWMADYIIEPLLGGLYFQTPDEVSKALALATVSVLFRRARTLALLGGLGILPETLASQLTIQLNNPVERFDLRKDTAVVYSAGGDYFADYIISAVPAPVAQVLFDEANPIEKALLETSYSSTLTVSIGTDEQWSLPPSLEDIYGVLVPRTERRLIASVGIEKKKSADRASGGELLNIMTDNPHAVRMLNSDPQAVLRAVLKELDVLVPGVSDHMIFHDVYAWRHAQPRSPVGRSSLVQMYRKALRETPRRVVLAGDYLGMPFTEGAAETGIWAANRIMAWHSIS